MIASLLAVTAAVAAADSPPVPSPPPVPTLTAVWLQGRIDLDGSLADAGWAAAQPSDAFTQQYPRERARPTEQTTVRVLYDDRFIYFGIDCVQRSVPIVARLTRRDRLAPADRVTIDISSRADRTTAFHFGVSAGGVLDDGIYFNDADYSPDWDENWQAMTSVRADGWSVEVRIPFGILRFDAAATQRWGLQIQRYVEGLHEWDLWSWRPRISAGFVSTFGILDGLGAIPPPRAVELRWSELAQLRVRDTQARGALAPSHDWNLSFEFDEKLHPTQGTTFDLTINPDFGQVEADQVVLNLSNYEVFYPEKRPFFLEGQDSWSTPRSVLYTRRIGARPADPAVASDETLIDHVGPSRIWAAAKFVGAATPNTGVGMLSAITGENLAKIAPMNGAAGAPSVERVAEPLSIFNAVRVRRAFGWGGDLGVLATSTNRLERIADPRTTDDAYVAAVDGRWRSPSANYGVSGQIVGSLLAGGPPRTQSDGIAIAPGHPALGATVAAAKQGGDHWLATLSEAVSGRQLDYNDLGYLERKNDSATYADLTYRSLDPWWWTTDSAITAAASHRQTLDGIRLEDNLRLSAFAMFTNFWASSFTLYYRAAHFDDRETGDGTALERAALAGAELWVGSDSRRLFTASFWAQAQQLADGAQVQASASVSTRPLPRLDLEIAPSALFTAGEPRFVGAETGARVYYFGKLRASNASITARATVGFSPTLTLQLYTQLFLATKHYSDFVRFDGTDRPQRTEVPLAALVAAALPGSITNPDRQQATLNVNAVLRWEYRLGSTLYLVYTRAQNPDPAVSRGQVPRLDPGALAGNRGSTDVLMLKASFWWG